MTPLKTLTETNLDYVDFSYVGYSIIDISTSYEILQLSISTEYQTVAEYPLGDILKVYPLGSNISLYTFNKKIKIKCNWSVDSGTLYLKFYTREGIEIQNSGIKTTSNALLAVETILDIPDEAFYLKFKNVGGSLATIKNILLFSIENTSINAQSSLLLREVDALKNVFKLWLFSNAGDYGRKIHLGGVLDFIIGKPLNESMRTEIFKKLSEEITAKFYNLVPQDLVIVADTENRAFRITLYLSDIYNKFNFNVPLLIKQ